MSIRTSFQNVLFWSTNKTGCICFVHLVTFCCVRSVSPCTGNTHNTHIKVDRWMKRLYYSPCQFSSNYTWQWDTYGAASRDNSLPSNRGNTEDMAFCVYNQPLLSDFDRCHPWQLVVFLPCRKCLQAMVPNQTTANTVWKKRAQNVKYNFPNLSFTPNRLNWLGNNELIN